MTAESAPTEESDPAGASTGRRRSPLLTASAALLFAGLTVAAVLLGLHDTASSSPAPPAAGSLAQQQAALAAARAEAVALTTISWRTTAQDLDRILAGSTGSLHQKFELERAHLGALRRSHSVSTGTALSSGLQSLNPTTGAAQVLVAVDATISGPGSSPVVKHYRMVLTLRRITGHWLADNVAFAGVPQ